MATYEITTQVDVEDVLDYVPEYKKSISSLRFSRGLITIT